MSLLITFSFICLYRNIEINSHWLSDTGNISQESCKSDKRMRSTSLFIGFASCEENISCIWKSEWINQYITFFITEHFKFISICFDVLKRSLLKHRYNDAKGYMEIEFLWPPFWFKKANLLILEYLGSEKEILHFTFTVIVFSASGPGSLKFIMDSLPFLV